jgi:hypothetical protein
MVPVLLTTTVMVPDCVDTVLIVPLAVVPSVVVTVTPGVKVTVLLALTAGGVSEASKYTLASA